MNEQELESRARQLLVRMLPDAPAGQRLLQRDSESDEYPELTRTISDHFFSILNPGTDITVFFDAQGTIAGWRDHGRRGVAVSAISPRESLLAAVKNELQLSQEAWLGDVKPALFPPSGWTTQAVVFTRRAPGEQDIVRVWVDPSTLRIIQCLYGAAPPAGIR